MGRSRILLIWARTSSAALMNSGLEPGAVCDEMLGFAAATNLGATAGRRAANATPHASNSARTMQRLAPLGRSVRCINNFIQTSGRSRTRALRQEMWRENDSRSRWYSSLPEPHHATEALL